MKVRFNRSYDHRWPSRAITHYPAGWSGTVKREVGEAAVSKGYATELRARGRKSSDARTETTDMAATGGLAGSDGRNDRGGGVLGSGDGSAGERQ